VSGSGTQVLSGGNISFSGSTTINPGATLVLERTTAYGNGVGGANQDTQVGDRSITNNGTLQLQIENGAGWTFNRAFSGSGGLTRYGNGTLTITGTGTVGAGVRIIDGFTSNGATNINANMTVTGGGFHIEGIQNLNTVNWNSVVNVQSGGLTVRGTGDNVTNGAILNVTSNSTVSGAVDVRAGDLRLSGANGRLNGITTLRVGGSGSSAGGVAAAQQGLNLINTAAANNTDRIPNAAAITLDAGRIGFSGTGTDGSQNFSETLGAVTLAGGSSLIFAQSVNAATAALTFQSLGSRAAGSTLVFDTVVSNADTGATIGFTSAPSNDVGGILGGWAVRSTSRPFPNPDSNPVQFREWATVSGGQIVPLASYQTGAENVWSALNNVKLASAQTLSADRTIHSLNIQDTTGRTLTINPQTSTASRTLVINSGGILSTRATHTITGGFLTAGTYGGSASPYELMFHLPTNQLNVSSVITDNGANAVGVTKSGNSLLVLNPQIALNVSRTAGIATVNLGASHQTNQITVGSVVTGAGIPAGTTVVAINSATQIVLSNEPTTTASGNLTFDRNNTYTGRTTINEGTIQITEESDLGANPAAFNAGQLTMNGGILRVNADMAFDDANRGITIGVADGLFRVANNRAFTVSPANLIDGTGGRLIFAADANSRGVMIVNGNHDFSGGLETNGAQGTVFTATLSSGLTAGSALVNVPTTAGLEVGAEVAGDGIPDGATIVRIVDQNTVELSAPATAGGTENLSYGNFNTLRLTGDNTIGFIRMIGSSIALQGTNTLTDDILVTSGRLRLGGNNTFNGSLTVTAGLVRFESETALNTPGGYNLYNDGTIDLNGHTTTVRSLTGLGTVTNNSTVPSTLVVNAANSFTYAGNFSNGTISGGSVSLVKNGNGILTLTGAASTYTGPTVINGGGILVSGLSFGGSASAIGAASNAASNLVLNGGTLRYRSNVAAFTDRSFTLGTGANAGSIIADGNLIGSTLTIGFAGLSPAVEFLGTGGRVLTLGGANRGDNRFNLTLGDGPEGPTSVTKTGTGTWVMGATNSYKGETLVLSGILAATADGAFGASGGAGVVVAGGTNGSAILGNNNATVDLRNVNYATVQTMYLAGGTLATTTGTSRWAGPVFATGNSQLSIGKGATLTLSGIIGGSNALTQLGEGTLILSGQADATTRDGITTSGPHHFVQAGILRLDYSANNNSKLADTGVLVLGGGRLGGAVELAGGTHVEVVSSSQVNAGNNKIERLSGTSILRMNGISRQVGGTVNFAQESIASTDTDNVSGILGAWATVGTDDWAFKSSFSEAGVDTGVTTGADKLIRRYTGYNNSSSANDWVLSSVTGNMNVVGDNTQNNSLANTLRFHSPDPDLVRRVTLQGANLLNAGGILVTPNMAGSDAVIDGTGMLATGRSATGNLISDLVIIQNNITAHAEIAALVANASADRTSRSATTADGSTAVSGIANTADLYVNMLVSGPGIAANTRITAISANGVTLSAPAGAGAGAGTLTFSQDRIATTTAGNTTVTLPDASGLFAGMVVSGPGILPDTRISSVSGLNIVLNTAPGAGAGAGTLSFFTPTGLDKSGPGDLILSGRSTYTGITSLNEGTLTVNQLAVQGFAGNTAMITNVPSIGRTVTVGSTDGLTIGQLVTGVELPAGGVTITAINSPTTFTLSNGALTTATANLTYGSNIAPKSGVLNANTAINNAVVTLVGGATTDGLTTGQAVSGPGIPAGAVILNILNTTQFTLGEGGNAFNATATGNNVGITFGAAGIFSGERASNTTSGTLITVASTFGMTVGQPVSGNNIPGGSVITRILDANTVEISNPLTGTGQVNRTFGVSATIGDTLASNLTVGSTTVTVPSTQHLSVGQAVSGEGIPAGAIVAAVLSSTEIRISVPALISGTPVLVFADQASNVGASRNAAGNLVFNGAVFQYNGTNGATDRSFTINSEAIWDVGNASTVLTVGGNYGTSGVEEAYRIVKRGEGTMDLRGTAFGGYGLESLLVEDGTLRLSPAFNDQYVRNDVGGLHLGGGTLDVRSIPGRTTTQNMVGDFRVLEGASVVRLTGSSGSGSFLFLQDINAPSRIFYERGGTVLFDVSGGSTVAQISLAGQALVDVGVVMPRVTFTNRSVLTPGVNNFGFVDTATSLITGSDIQGAHNFVADPAQWVGSQNVHDGILAEESYRGTSPSGASVKTILFFNNSYSIAGDLVASNPVISRVPAVDRLAVGQLVRGNGIPEGAYITAIDVPNNTITLSQAPTASSTSTTLYAFDNAFVNGNTNAGSALVTGVSDSRLRVGQTLVGAGIPAGTTIVAIDTVNSTITLSQNATGTATAVPLYSEYLAQVPVALNSSVVGITDSLSITGGAILQTTMSGNHLNSFGIGQLTSGLANTDGTSADLIIHNWNPANALVINSTIVNNASLNRVVNLVHTGDGTTALTGVNTYTGTTFVQGGVLRLDHVFALPETSHLRLDGGVIGLNAGNFSRALGTAAGQIDWTSSGGFAAYGADRQATIGAGGAVTWGSGGFVPDNVSLILGAQDATAVISFTNGIDLGRKSRMVEVVSGRSSSAVDARLTGTLTGDAGVLVKSGQGVLELAASNTYTGGTSLAAGGLVGGQNGSFGTGSIMVGTTTDTTAPDHLRLTFGGTSLGNSVSFGGENREGVSTLSFSASAVSVTGTVEIDRLAGRNLAVVTTPAGSVTFQGAVSGTGGLVVRGGGTLTLSGSNSYGTLTGPAGSAVNGGTVLRHGALQIASATALGGTTTIELGDASHPHASADWATNGASIMGVERGTDFDTQRNSGLGGAFESAAGGLAPGGLPNAGPGAFYNVSRVIDGRTFGSADIGKTILVKDEVLNPERNGIYAITQVNTDGTMNLVRTSTFSTTANMLYGTQVTVTGGSAAGTYFMAAPNVSTVNGTGTDPVYWQQDTLNPNVTLSVTNPAVTTITQAVDINANGSGTTSIVAANPVTFSGNVTLQNVRAGVQESKTLTLNSTASGAGLVLSGIVSEATAGSGPTDDILSLVKVGAGVVSLTGANTYKGGTTVSGGSLLVNNTAGSGTGLGSVTVQSGATLAGSGILAPAPGANVSINSGASLVVGVPGALAGDDLTVSLQAGSTFQLAGSLRLDLFSNQAGSTLAEADRLVLLATGSPTVNITGSSLFVSNVNSLAPGSFNVGDTWKLIDWAGLSPTGTFSNLSGTYSTNFADLPDLGAGRFWDISQLYSQGTIVVAVPEPGRLVLLIVGLLALMARRRRRF
jgi:autotransporter-associated beta strand protein